MRVLVYDGECGFCRYTVEYAAAVVGDAVEFRPYQEVAGEYSDVSVEEFRASIQLFTPERRFSGTASSIPRESDRSPSCLRPSRSSPAPTVPRSAT